MIYLPHIQLLLESCSPSYLGPTGLSDFLSYPEVPWRWDLLRWEIQAPWITLARLNQFFYLGCGQPVRHAWEWWNRPELYYLSCHFGHGEILGPRLLNQRSERLLENAHQLLDSVSPMWTPGAHYFAGCHDMVWSFDVFWRNTAVFHWNTLLLFFIVRWRNMKSEKTPFNTGWHDTFGP